MDRIRHIARAAEHELLGFCVGAFVPHPRFDFVELSHRLRDFTYDPALSFRGWLKTVALLRKTRHRGVRRVGWMFTFAAAVYNLVRIRNLTWAEAGT
jgi:hypothetical protein